ncbi:glucuronosyltransferase [Trifolium repens]|nr:glucuronosyltransferase [Trifolium repens]
MKLWLSNTGLNPKRKFWKCRNIGMDGCDFLVWDDELEEVEAANPKSRGLSSINHHGNLTLININMGSRLTCSLCSRFFVIYMGSILLF